MSTRSQHRGFTLIELVVTLTLSMIVVGFVSLFISGPVQGFTDQTRRARLVDAADTALRRMGRDVRRACRTACARPSPPESQRSKC